MKVDKGAGASLRPPLAVLSDVQRYIEGADALGAEMAHCTASDRVEQGQELIERYRELERFKAGLLQYADVEKIPAVQRAQRALHASLNALIEGLMAHLRDTIERMARQNYVESFDDSLKHLKSILYYLELNKDAFETIQ